MYLVMERKVIGERTKSALAHKKAIGEKYAPVPFGYKEVEGRLEKVKKETALVAEIIERRAAGATLKSIADWLNGKGIIGKQGGKWYACIEEKRGGLMARLEAELKHLFGADVVKQSIDMDYRAALDEVKAIPEITEKLSSCEGQPAKQRDIVKTLSDESAAALCYWLRAV